MASISFTFYLMRLRGKVEGIGTGEAWGFKEVSEGEEGKWGRGKWDGRARMPEALRTVETISVFFLIAMT